MAGNNDVLTAVEFERYRPHPDIVSRIEACRQRFTVPKSAFRIIDWGCGRGQLVLWLREQGYDAVGADIDPRPFANGQALFTSRGHSPDDCLHALDTEGRAPFADGRFHFIVSWQTLEHVRDLDGVVREFHRLTRDGGEGFHVYPPHRRIVEAHLFMPIVHWLPKNGLRRSLMMLCLLLRIEPHWWPDRRKPLREKLDVYYRYSVDETFYRPPRQLRASFSAQGFEVEFTDVGGGRRWQPWLERCFSADLSSRIVRIWYMNYGRDLGLATRRIAA